MGRKRPPSDFGDRDEPRIYRRTDAPTPVVYDDEDEYFEEEYFEPEPPPKRRIWPYALVMILIWGILFSAIVWSHFVSDLPDVRNLTATAAPRDVTILELANLNHLFQTARTGAVGEYADIEETVAPVALDAMSSWIRKHTAR